MDTSNRSVPVEIYHNSQTEFVCDFIGDINVFNDETVHELLLKNARFS